VQCDDGDDLAITIVAVVEEFGNALVVEQAFAY